jgi:hypothetical protein
MEEKKVSERCGPSCRLIDLKSTAKTSFLVVFLLMFFYLNGEPLFKTITTVLKEWKKETSEEFVKREIKISDLINLCLREMDSFRRITKKHLKNEFSVTIF